MHNKLKHKADLGGQALNARLGAEHRDQTEDKSAEDQHQLVEKGVRIVLVVEKAVAIESALVSVSSLLMDPSQNCADKNREAANIHDQAEHCQDNDSQIIGGPALNFRVQC